MSDLIVIGFDDPNEAEMVKVELIQMQRTYMVDLEDAVVAVKNEDGKVKLNQMHHLTAQGTIAGTFWGTLIGLIFMSPLVGAAAGAAAGAVAGTLSDVGIDDRFMKELSETLQPGTSALFILVRKAPTDKVLEELSRYKGKVIQTSLSHEDEKAIQAAFEEINTSRTN